MLFGTAYEFETPIPLIAPESAKVPPTGYGTLSDRTAWSGISPARAMRVPGIGLQHRAPFGRSSAQPCFLQ
jgi:hypothetical protein